AGEAVPMHPTATEQLQCCGCTRAALLFGLCLFALCKCVISGPIGSALQSWARKNLAEPMCLPSPSPRKDKSVLLGF
ncbi:unnamed protein product, partial [Bubo scandiacus]